jgi:minor extracellular serine protease Vpr
MEIQMKTKLFIAEAMVFMMPLCANAQSVSNVPFKWDGVIQKCIVQKTPLISVIMKCSDSQLVADKIIADGYKATVITDKILTARVPSTYIPRLAEDKTIEYIQSPRKATASMTEARKVTGVDKIQSGEGLDTPYTGKGVIVGVIDQGFEFRHLAFLDSDNKSRVIALWNRKGYSAGEDSDPTTTIPSAGDGFDSYGHATHVTNIAAGSKVKENDYYGMAPDADIVMIPSEFVETEVVEDVKYISDLAKQRGEPWVINMSFGTQVGSHDGKNYFCQALDDILADGCGHQIVAAAGNDGYFVQHTSYTLKSDKDTVRLMIESGGSGALVDIWGQSTDSLKHLKVTPYIYSSDGKAYQDSTFWSHYMNTASIAPYNKKEEYEIGVSPSVLSGGLKLGVEISGDAGTSFHAWTNQGYGNIVDGPDDTYLKGNQDYCVEALAASANNDVTVGAFVSSDSYTNYRGTTVNGGCGALGDMAVFSSMGPSLCDSLKPTIAAPGSVIKSAVSKYGASFSKDGSDVVQDISRGIKHFYYSAMSGTSMATPAVTGIIALWLQANPKLTYSQILNIIKTTATKDDFTGQEEWNARWGYGKINAYEGLKEALKLADANGITAVYNSETPVTISKESGLWRLLFNTSERYADVSVYDINGILISSQHYSDLQRGQEKTISFVNLKHGVYIVKINTTANTITRKFSL